MKYPLLTASACLLAASASQAALVWTGAGDGVSLYQEANWLDDNGAVPSSGEIDGNTPVTATTGGLIEISSGIGTPNNWGPTFNIGANDLNVGGGKNLTSSATNGLVSADDGLLQSVNISGASTVNVQFLNRLTVSVDEASTLRLRGGGNPINGGSTIFLADISSSVIFNDEDFAAFESEHLGKFSTLFGPGVLGATPDVFEPGDTLILSTVAGNTVVNAIPEPSLTLLGSLGLLGILRRRR